jgi:hypothetical protein
LCTCLEIYLILGVSGEDNKKRRGIALSDYQGMSEQPFLSLRVAMSPTMTPVWRVLTSSHPMKPAFRIIAATSSDPLGATLHSQEAPSATWTRNEDISTKKPWRKSDACLQFSSTRPRLVSASARDHIQISL